MFFLGKLGKTLFISFFAFGILIISIDAVYVEYKRAENAKNIELLKLLPAGADKVNYISDNELQAAVYQFVDMAREDYLSHKNIKGEELLYRFMSWTTKDLEALCMGFYSSDDGSDDLYVLKHKKSVKKPEFISPEFDRYVKKIDNYSGVDIYQIEIRRGSTYGIIYFAWIDKYVIHSSNMELLKKSLDIIFGRKEKTAYDEFEHLIKKIPKKYWGTLALEHIKKQNTNISYLGSGELYKFNIIEYLNLVRTVTSDPRKLNSGNLRTGITLVYYVVLQCKDEKCANKYADLMYEYKGFDIKVEDNYVHAKRFAWEPGKYRYAKSGMFPYSESYLAGFIFFGYEWRGNKIDQYSIQSPEFQSKVESWTEGML